MTDVTGQDIERKKQFEPTGKFREFLKARIELSEVKVHELVTQKTAEYHPAEEATFLGVCTPWLVSDVPNDSKDGSASARDLKLF